MKPYILLTALLSTPVIAAQCPSIHDVLNNNQWQTPAGWQQLPLSPLAGDTGKHTFAITGLTHVFYLSSTKNVRCTYIKAGTGVQANTYVIKQHVPNFQPGKGNWQHIIDNTVWRCAAKTAAKHMTIIKPEACLWNTP
ncbi:MAG: hypothetical protein CMF39_01080 [Legionellaceae bacterium]|nr:hypothetical protein [Legionellaceae bacterium]